MKLIFFPNKEFFRFFAAKLGHFTIIFFLYVTNTQGYRQKSENEEKNVL